VRFIHPHHRNAAVARHDFPFNDYIESSCKRKDYTKALSVSAWTESPALVPCIRWVTLPGRSPFPACRSVGVAVSSGGVLFTWTL
jgi:hypothetical protein